MNRREDILTYLSTNKMLLGLDLKSIDIVIFVQPYNMVAAPVQGGGRGGRKKGTNGFRDSVQVYQLWNQEDLSQNNNLMSNEMRTLCRTGVSSCTREFLTDNFNLGDRDIRKVVLSDPMGCCHSCDLRQQQSL